WGLGRRGLGKRGLGKECQLVMMMPLTIVGVVTIRETTTSIGRVRDKKKRGNQGRIRNRRMVHLVPAHPQPPRGRDGGGGAETGALPHVQQAAQLPSPQGRGRG